MAMCNTVISHCCNCIIHIYFPCCLYNLINTKKKKKKFIPDIVIVWTCKLFCYTNSIIMSFMLLNFVA